MTTLSMSVTFLIPFARKEIALDRKKLFEVFSMLSQLNCSP